MFYLELPAEKLLPKMGHKFSRKAFSTPHGRICVKMSSDRLECFRRNATCVTCGLTGNVFRMETNKGQATPHWNFYHKAENGKLTLMTKDHIVPLSKGGEDNISNLQTMCTHCNNRKGDKFSVILIEDGTVQLNPKVA